LRELAAYRDAVREEERKRIALEIHDELGQLLTALKMDISLLRMQFETNAEIGKKTADMRELVEKTIGVVRQVATNLRPAALNLGIVPALEWLVEDFGQRTGIAYELNLSGGDRADDVRRPPSSRIVRNR
jgi:signal transduction histidine kinase